MNFDTLTREEFAVALRHGRGRAMMYIKQFGLGDVSDLVLEACLHNQSYDSQCEDSRAEWLLDLFANSEEYPCFVSEIVTALDERPTNCWDVSQLCFLAALLAERGEGEARQALRDAALLQAREGDPWIGLHALISIEGLDGILALAHCYGQRLYSDIEDTPPLLVDIVESRELLEQAKGALKSLSSGNREIAAYWNFCEANTQMVEEVRKKTTKRSRREYRKQVRQELPLKKILADASKKVGSLSQFMRFGRHATKLELTKVLNHLIAENDEAVIQRLLWVFRRVCAPELHPRFFELASSSNDNIRSAARVALAQFQHPRVGEFARDILRKERLMEPDLDVLDLLILNYEPSDTSLVISVLCGLKPTDDHAHGLGLSVLNIFGENEARELKEALCWVYDSTPCTICRRECLECLKVLGEVAPHIVEECCYDASEQTRQLAQELMSCGS